MDDLIDGSTSTHNQISNKELNELYNSVNHLNLNNNFEFNYSTNQFQEFMESNHTETTNTCTPSSKRNSSILLTKEECKQSQKQSVIKSSAYTIRKHLIIWDWDDSLFPTYAFRTHQDKKDKDFMLKFSILTDYIYKIFVKMISLYGSKNIIIVTNGSPKWINKCLNVDIVQHTLMKFQMLLKKYKIKTISASTSKITSKYPNNHHKWKEIVFRDYFNKYFQIKNDKMTVNCITSIGDSLCEYKASNKASKHISNRILNRVRLKSNPSINDMILQFKHILNLLNINKFGLNTNDIEIDYSFSFKSNYVSSSYSDTTC